MAKTLLWTFVVVNLIINLVLSIAGETLNWYEDLLPTWVGIAVLAVCESVEKAGEKK